MISPLKWVNVDEVILHWTWLRILIIVWFAMRLQASVFDRIKPTTSFSLRRWWYWIRVVQPLKLFADVSIIVSLVSITDCGMYLFIGTWNRRKWFIRVSLAVCVKQKLTFNILFYHCNCVHTKRTDLMMEVTERLQSTESLADEHQRW